MKHFAWVVVLVASGCIDLEGAYFDCVDGGRCRSADAGEVDAGLEGDAGTDAGADAGTDAGFDAGYDGGPACNSSPHAHLRCAPALDLSIGAPVKWAALAAIDGGFVAAWVGATIEVRRVGLDRTVTTLLTGVAQHDGYVTLDAKANDWAVGWTVDGGATARCQASGSNVTTVTLRDGGTLRDFSVAVNGAGGVALIGVEDGANRAMAAQGSGCPDELQRLVDEVANGSMVVSTSEAGGDGFRYLWSDQINAYNGSVNFFGELSDGGGLRTVRTPHNSAPWSIGAHASTSGENMLAAVVGAVATGTRLEVSLVRSDLKSNGSAFVIDGGANIGWWNVASCGTGCFAVARLKSDSVGPAAVSFFSDTAPLKARGTWDAVCDISAVRFGSTVSIAGLDERLGVLVTTSATARLYVCDAPPLLP